MASQLVSRMGGAHKSVRSEATWSLDKARLRRVECVGPKVKELKAEDIRDAAVVLTGIDEERRAA